MLTRGWLVEDMTGSPFLVSMVMAAMMLPMLFLSLFGGVLADRFARHKVVAVGDFSTLAGFAVLFLLVMLDMLNAWQVIAVSFWNGIGFALSMPARQTLAGGLVHREQLRTAVGLSMTTYSTSQIVGASVAGIMIAQLGAEWTLGISTLLLVPAILAYGTLRPHRHGASVDRKTSAIANLKSGVKFTFASPALRTMMIGALIVTITIGPFQALMPVFAAEVLKVGPAALGNLVLAAGCGSLTGSLVVIAFGTRFGQRKTAIFSGVIAALALAGFASSSLYLASVALVAVTSMAMTAFMVNNMTGVQMESPDEVRGRVLSLRFLLIGFQPIGAVGLGALSEVYGAQVAVASFALAGAVMLLAAHVLRHASERIGGLKDNG